MSYAKAHNEDIRRLLSGYSENVVLAFQQAVYLMLDATDSLKDKNKILESLEYLKKYEYIRNEINYADIITPNDGSHQWYSHLEWDYDYIKNPAEGWNMQKCEEQQKKYQLRKEILVSTVKCLFNNLDEYKVNSIAAMLYYTHITGDIRDNKKLNDLPSFLVLKREIEKHLLILFDTEANNLCHYVDVFLSNAVTILNNTNSEWEFDRRQLYMTIYMEIFTSEIVKLLKNLKTKK